MGGMVPTYRQRFICSSQTTFLIWLASWTRHFGTFRHQTTVSYYAFTSLQLANGVSMLVAHVLAGDGGCDAFPFALWQLNMVNHWSSFVTQSRIKVVARGTTWWKTTA